jgi:hypothetical protein
MADLDFTGLSDADAKAIQRAIARGENLYGYIPSHGLEFIVRNYRALASLGILEAPWIHAYMHASHLSTIGETVVKSVFDACDRARLLALRPLGDAIALGRDERDRITLFRGCAGPVHSLGMSWTPSLDKAIWYAAKHAAYYRLDNKAVYVTTVPIKDIYCRLDHYDDDFIVYPQQVWRVDVPAKEFRLDRRR